MQIILNEDHLLLSDIEEYASKARAILVDDDNRIIVANYNGALLLPGGSLDKNETPILFADKIKTYAFVACSNCYNTCRISFTDVAKANARVFKVCCPWCEYENTVTLKDFNDSAKFIFEKV